MRRCLLDDRAHLVILQSSNVMPACQQPVVAGVNLRLEDFSPLLDTGEDEAALLAARRLANYLTEAQDESSVGIIGMEPELLTLTLERLEQCVSHHTQSNLERPEGTRFSAPSHQILGALLSIFTAICAKPHILVLTGIVSADDTVENSLEQRLSDSNSIVRRLLHAAQSFIECSTLRYYEAVTMALRLVGNLTTHGLCVACYLLDSGTLSSVYALLNADLYTCFTSIRAEVQWVFTAIASHFPSDQGGDKLVARLDHRVSSALLSETYLEIALHSATSYIASSIQSMNTCNDSKRYDRWYLSIRWLMYSFMCPCLVSRDSISNVFVLELILKSISVPTPDISSIAIAALNQYSMNVPRDVKDKTIFTGHAVALLRHGFTSIATTYIDANIYGKAGPYYASILKEALIFLNNENSDIEIPGFWVQTIANLYARLLRAHRVPSTDTTEMLELLTEALGSTVSICSNETMNVLCSSNARIFAQLIRLLKSYKPCVQMRKMTWKSNSILLNISELLRTMIDYVPDTELELHKHDLMETINVLLGEKIDAQTADILEELQKNLSYKDD
ncbi:Hypothetical protein GLP15_3566 [Giardia lamblia P15]|uniref:Uncharacterized protein n=1 Tax=Giardia intestinalis (strain P15) TaxID=658858 RepID=E1F7H7_GIAIA|nr:Hypothetical protein GLP15_3566 [Giardia lamblia P15]